MNLCDPIDCPVVVIYFDVIEQRASRQQQRLGLFLGTTEMATVPSIALRKLFWFRI